MNEQHIGLFGGSFNPIHFGHLNLAIEMFERRELTKIYFCPANLNPFKSQEKSLAGQHRLEMLKLAISNIPEFLAIENELQRPAPSYTIDTIEELLQAEKNSNVHLYLIIGEDAISSFHTWHRAQEIIQLTTLLVGIRSGSRPLLNSVDAPIQEAILAGMTPTKTIDISSTEIRERIRLKKYCAHLLPLEVLDYIYTNQLYLNT